MQGDAAEEMLGRPDHGPGAAVDLAAAVLDETERRSRDAGPGRPDGDSDGDMSAGQGDAVSLREATAQAGTAPLVVLTLVMAADELDRAALTVLAPDIQESLGVSNTVLAAIAGASGALLVLGAVPLGVLADRTKRTRLTGLATLSWAVIVALTGLARNAFQLFTARMVTGLGQSNVLPVHNGLLADTYPLGARGRIFGIHGAGRPFGQLLGPLAAGLLAAAIGGPESWRWVFALLAIPSIVLGLAALRLPEPRRGGNEQLALLDHLGNDHEPSGGDLPVSTSAAFERLNRIRTFHFMLLGVATVGFSLFAVPLLVSLHLEQQYSYDAFDRGLLLALVQAGPLLAAPLAGRHADRLARKSFQPLLVLAGGCVGAFGVLAVGALYLPGAPALGVGLAAAQSCSFAAFVLLPPVTAAVVPYRLRSQGFALVGVYLFLFGAFGGLLVTGALSDAFGERTALTVTVPPAALLGGALIAFGARHVDRDVVLARREVEEEHAEAQRLAAATSPDDIPMLQVRQLDASYGPVQVLFEVDLEVRRGETVALLGTNGAGKSTLLRAISGLLVPDRGVVRMEGRAVTLTEAERRPHLGLMQVRGGEAVFPGLTVAEHLDLYAREVRNGSEVTVDRRAAAFDVFPALVDRLNVRAGDLSGGQQQMLAVSRALLVRPKLLVIDELSLGLAPVTVEELVVVIRALQADGISMLLVEQSVTTALRVADRAVFMERGRVRFDGATAELAQRDDLLRSVFLGGEGR